MKTETSEIPLFRHFTEEEFVEYTSKMELSQKYLLTQGFLFGQMNGRTEMHKEKVFTLVTEMAGELGTEKITLTELLTKFNHKVANFGRTNTKEDAVFTNEKDALDFIADGGGEEL
jgi:hypothetical protein